MAISTFRRKFLALCGIMAFAVFVSYAEKWFIQSEEDDFRKLALEISQISSFEKPEHPLDQIAKAKQLVSYCSENILLTRDDKTWNLNKDEVLQKITGLRTLLNNLETDIEVQSISISQDNTANLRLIVSASGKIASEDGPFFDRHLVSVTLNKQNGEWLISSGEYIENLRKPIN